MCAVARHPTTPIGCSIMDCDDDAAVLLEANDDADEQLMLEENEGGDDDGPPPDGNDDNDDPITILAIPDDLVEHMAFFCSMSTVCLMERVFREWRSALSDRQGHLWRHLMFLEFPRMYTLLPHLPLPLQSYRAICRNQHYAEQLLCWPRLSHGPVATTPLDAYTFTVELSLDHVTKHVCSGRLAFDNVRTADDELAHLAAFRCASPLWRSQPQWFSWLDYWTLNDALDLARLTINTFVTLGDSTRLFYESTIACDVDGTGPHGQLYFSTQRVPPALEQSLPHNAARLLCNMVMVVHGGEPQRSKGDPSVILYDNAQMTDKTGDVLFLLERDSDDYDPINNETSAVRILERHLASYKW